MQSNFLATMLTFTLHPASWADHCVGSSLHFRAYTRVRNNSLAL